MSLSTCIVCGSPRKTNHSIKLALALKRALHQKTNQEPALVDFRDYDIPLMAQGSLNPTQLSPFQQHLFDSMSKADLVILISPEYNWMPSAEMINFIHQMADKPYASMWDGKVFGVCGVSNGRGGRFPVVQLSYVLNKILGFMGFDSFVSPRGLELQFIHQTLGPEGEVLNNPEFEKGMDAFLIQALRYADTWKSGRLQRA